MKVPFNDLSRIHEPLEMEFISVFRDSLASSNFIGGPWVSEFESLLEKYFEVSNVVGVSNGTDAISVALRALNLPANSQVLTASNSWISSAEVINEVGLQVGFTDVGPSGNMTLETLEKAVTENTKAVIAVHLRGSMCDIERISEFCSSKGLYLIEDCAQSHLSRFNGRVAGSFGDVATFSFYPGKNLGALGDSGALSCKSKETSDKARAIANHGALVKHEHFLNGTNARMSPLMARILSIKLRYLEHWTHQRRDIATRYQNELEGINEISFYDENPAIYNTYHVFSILVNERDELMQYLKNKGIETAIHYPTIIPDQACYKSWNNGPFETARSFSQKNLSLPIFPEMKGSEVNYVIKMIKEFYRCE